ncbi:MAG: D-amino acid aminotransferase [Chromatiales bacterium]
MSIVYLNGEYLPLEHARISVLDRGFIFGDGVYEVVPSFSGFLFRLEQHLKRLDNSLRAVRMGNPFTHAQWESILDALIERNGGGNQSVYLQVTRGAGYRDHVPSAPVPQTVFAMCNAVTHQNQEPVSALLCEDIRWKWCQIKSIALLPNVLMRLAARDEGAYEAILIRDGLLTEGAASNVFVVSDGLVRTPPHSENLLPGVTRDLIVELLHRHQIPCAETAVTETEVRAAEEIWLTSSTREIVPVAHLDGKPVGAGVPGPVWRRALRIYESFRDAEVAARRGRGRKRADAREAI